MSKSLVTVLQFQVLPNPRLYLNLVPLLCISQLLQPRPTDPTHPYSLTMATQNSAGVPILDIRGDDPDQSLLDLLHDSLSPSEAQRPTFPTLLLYDGTEVLDV